MYQMDKDKARHVLLEEGFEEYQVDLLLKSFLPVDDRFGPVIEKWLKDRTISDIVVDNISILDVMDTRHSHFLVAIRDMNKLLDPDLISKKREQWRRILTTPIFYE